MKSSDYALLQHSMMIYQAFLVPPYTGDKGAMTIPLNKKINCDSQKQVWETSENAALPAQSTCYLLQTTPAQQPDSTCCEERSHPVYLDWSTKDLPFDPDAVAEKEVGRGGPKAMFPKLLYQLLEDAENEDFTNICAWQPHGRAFIIHDKKAFQKKIMPRYFTAKGVKYTSFRRQLNLYGFLRIVGPESADNNAYYHEMFLRGRPDLFRFVIRTRIRGTLRRSTLKVDSEPDIAEFPPMPPLTPAAHQMKSKQAIVKVRQCRPSNAGNKHLHKIAKKAQKGDKTLARSTEMMTVKQPRALHPVKPKATNVECLSENPFFKVVLPNLEDKAAAPRAIVDDSDDHSLVAFLEDVFQM